MTATLLFFNIIGNSKILPVVWVQIQHPDMDFHCPTETHNHKFPAWTLVGSMFLVRVGEVGVEVEDNRLVVAVHLGRMNQVLPISETLS